MDRRTFIKTAAASSAVSALPRVVRADDEPAALPIVDTHQHLWDLRKFNLAWLETVPEILNRNYLARDYMQAIEGLHVEQSVYLEVDVDVPQQPDEAAYVIELCQNEDIPTAGGVISGRCDSEDFETYIRNYEGSPYIKGLRHILQSAERGLCLQPRFIKSVQLLGEIGMSFDLTIGPTELDDGLQLVKKCPGTLFVVDHCGVADPKAFMPAHRHQSAHRAEPWKRSMAALADEKNTVCKISGIIASVPEKWDTADLAVIVNHCLDVFGPDRVMFGSDWPVCLLGATLEKWVMTLKEIVSEYPLSAQRKLFADNAKRHYRLEG